MATSGGDPWILSVDKLVNDAGFDRIRRQGSHSVYRIPPYVRMLKPHRYNYDILPLGLYNKNMRDLTSVVKLQLEVVHVVLKHLNLGWHDFRLRVAPQSDAAALENFYHDPPSDSFSTPQSILDVLIIDAVFVVVKLLRIFKFDPQPAVIVDLLEIFSRGDVLFHLSSFSRDMFWLFENQIPLSLVRNVWREISLVPANEIPFDRALRVNLFYAVKDSRLPNPDPGHRYERSRISDSRMSRSFDDCDHLLSCLHKAVCMDSPTIGRVEGTKFWHGISRIGGHLRYFLTILGHGPLGLRGAMANVDNHQRMLNLPTMSELKRAGIQCRGVETGISGICFVKSFFNATLELPKIEFHDSTEKFLLNMCIYEWMNTTVKQKVTAYILLMDDLISTVEDVQLLREGDEPVIVANYAGEDKMVADLFSNTLQGFNCVDEALVHFDDVKDEILSWYGTPWRHYAIRFIEIYKIQPWLLGSIIVAALILTATILQTVYTIKGYLKS